MDADRITSFTKSPAEGAYRCGQCGHVLNLKQGQLVPPCPRCGFREFERTEGAVNC